MLTVKLRVRVALAAHCNVLKYATYGIEARGLYTWQCNIYCNVTQTRQQLA